MVVAEDAIGHDDVTQGDVAAPARAYAAHRETGRIECGDERLGSIRRGGRAHRAGPTRGNYERRA